jgi:hypothetical protein
MKLARRLKSQEKSGIFFSPELDPKEYFEHHSLLTQELDERENLKHLQHPDHEGELLWP